MFTISSTVQWSFFECSTWFLILTNLDLDYSQNPEAKRTSIQMIPRLLSALSCSPQGKDLKLSLSSFRPSSWAQSRDWNPASGRSLGGRALLAIFLTVLCLEKKFCENDTIDSPYLFFLNSFYIKFAPSSDKPCLWEATLRKRSYRIRPLWRAVLCYRERPNAKEGERSLCQWVNLPPAPTMMPAQPKWSSSAASSSKCFKLEKNGFWWQVSYFIYLIVFLTSSYIRILMLLP